VIDCSLSLLIPNALELDDQCPGSVRLVSTEEGGAPEPIVGGQTLWDGSRVLPSVNEEKKQRCARQWFR
jgi:hypothetical protein